MSKKPKYRFGLLESPETSYLSRSSFATTLENTGIQENSLNDSSSKFKTPKIPLEPTSFGSGSLISKINKISPIIGGTAFQKTIESTKENSKSTPYFPIPDRPAPRSTGTPRIPNTSLNTSIYSSRYGQTPKSNVPKTPRSVKETPRQKESAVIVAIVEGRGMAKGEVGIASIDLKHPVLHLSQFTDTQTYIKTITCLQVLSPIEILFPSTMCCAGKITKIYEVVNDTFQSATISTVQRHYFNEAKGMDYLNQLGLPENQSSVEINVTNKYYCLSAASALIKYVEFVQNVMFASHSLNIQFSGSEKTTLIDASTAAVLELVVNASNPKSDHTLFGVLNHTLTTGGARILRCNILQPPNDIMLIKQRFECLNEITEDKDLFTGLKSCLERIEIDIDHMLTSIIQIPKKDTESTANNKITTCIYLKHILQMVPVILDVLSGTKCSLLKMYEGMLRDTRFNRLQDMIMEIIHEDVQYQKGQLNMRNLRCFAVKPDINTLLDGTRITYNELIEDFNEMVRQLAEKYELPLRSSYNTNRGFFIQMPISDKQPAPKQLPQEFVKITKTRKVWSFTTNDMIRLNQHVNQALKDISMMANAIVSHLLDDIRGNVGCLYNLSEAVASLDMMLSLAHVITISDYVEPEFTDTLALKKCRHPVLERVLGPSKVGKNDVYASDVTNFTIITGPNMSGKSTFLKQIALLQIMAQIGSFVPAEFASFRIADQIFSRVGSDDDIETNSSTFMLEMKEINYILRNIGKSSLVIIDELGRGTSNEEGVGLCWSIAEFLLMQKCFVFFATHFLELCQLETLYPSVENYHFKVDNTSTKIRFTYSLHRGHTSEKHYGLALAKVMNLPSQVVQMAEEFAVTIQHKNETVDTVVAKQQQKERAAHKLANRLLQVARNSQLDAASLLDYLSGLQKQYKKEAADLPVANITNNSAEQPHQSAPLTAHK